MTNPVIKVENLSKYYRLGVIGGGTLREDLSRWWARRRGKLDPYSKIGDDSGPQPKSGQVWALKDINLEVNEGEILGIIGRNGAGKSTLLKILSRITAPTAGRAVIKGRVGSLLEVGTGFHPELTGRENIYLNGAILGMRRAEVTRKLDEIVDFAEVDKFVDTPVKRYSSGMLVRLAFAVAAHLDPEILIVDEVLAVGDAAFQKKCLGKMRDVSSKGRTVLFVSHNMQSVTELTKNAVIIESGTITYKGTTDSAVKRYLHGLRDGQRQYTEHDQVDTSHISRAEVETSDPNNVHRFGYPLAIHLTLVNPVELREARIAIQIVDNRSAPIVHCALFGQEHPSILQSGKHQIKCLFRDPRLYKGQYALCIHLAQGTNQPKLQEITDICPFEIVMWSKPRLYPWQDDMCKYLEEYTWEISNISQP